LQCSAAVASAVLPETNSEAASGTASGPGFDTGGAGGGNALFHFEAKITKVKRSEKFEVKISEKKRKKRSEIL
jgi:hypothetical protein